MFNPTEAFQKIRRLQIKTLRNVDNFFAGCYRSAFKGKGLEFEDVREYQPGDDIRTIDWNVTARSQKTFVKNFREERELTLILAVDISASSHFSHTDKLKSEIIAELGALLAFSAIKNQDKVGLLLFSDQIELYLKPKKGIRHVLRVIRELLYFKPKSLGTNVKKALGFIGKVERKQALCFLISDFFSEPFEWEATLLSQRHELIALRVLDDYEKVFVPQGIFTLCDLENGQEVLVDTISKEVKLRYETEAEKNRVELKQLFERMGADFFSIDTKEVPAESLQRFFKLRERRKK